MPVKRRSAKRHLSLEEEYHVWELIFTTGRDFFNELPTIGLPKVNTGPLPLELVAEPWARLGDRYLAEHGVDKPCWALRELGQP